MLNSRRIALAWMLAAVLLAGCEEYQYPWELTQRQSDHAAPAESPHRTDGASSDSGGPAQDARAADPAQREELVDAMSRLQDAAAARSQSQASADDRQVVDSASEPPVGPPAQSQSTNATTALVMDKDDTSGKLERDAEGTRPAQMPPVILAVHIGNSKSLQTPQPKQPDVGINRELQVGLAQSGQALDDLIAHAQKLVEEDPGSIEKQWQLSLLQLAAGDERGATSLSPGLSQEAAGLMQSAIAVAAATGRVLTDPAGRYEHALSQTQALRRRLSERAELEVPVVALCSKVEAFGVYDELPAGALAAYRANRAILYCEIDNFLSDPREDDYQALLSSRIELFSKDGRSLWVRDEEHIEDHCRQERDDFFLAQLITLPDNLGPGEYVLKVTIKDLLASKANQGTLQFSIPGGQRQGDDTQVSYRSH